MCSHPFHLSQIRASSAVSIPEVGTSACYLGSDIQSTSPTTWAVAFLKREHFYTSCKHSLTGVTLSPLLALFKHYTQYRHLWCCSVVCRLKSKLPATQCVSHQLHSHIELNSALLMSSCGCVCTLALIQNRKSLSQEDHDKYTQRSKAASFGWRLF